MGTSHLLGPKDSLLLEFINQDLLLAWNTSQQSFRYILSRLMSMLPNKLIIWIYHENPLGINVSYHSKYGRLGRVESLKLKNLLDLSIGTRHMLALFDDGTLWEVAHHFTGNLE